ncbi:MAG TPA: transglutaminaseTgpA domain-containing protein [Candidatus Deferrimicrobium sp.]|nr:transglutaminaseTgpA domain-containing protein [Candidatus Deferrimicrobium sp.]
MKTWLKPLEVRAVLHATDHGLADTWRKKLFYPILLFVMFESLLYIIVRGYKLQGQLLPFTVIIVLSVLGTQIRLITGIYVSNLLVGPLTSLYFIHQKFYILQELTNPVWFKLLYRELKASVLSLLAKDFFSLGEVTITLCVMLGVWCLVYISLKNLVGRGRIIVLFLAGLVAQGLIFSYIDRTTNAANFVYLLSSLMLLSLTRLDKLQQRWMRLNMFGAEDLNIKWGAVSTLLIFCVVSLAALTPAPRAQMLVQDSRFQVIANLIGGTRSTQGSIEGEKGTWSTDSNQKNNSFEIQPEILGGPWFANNTLVLSVTSSKPIYLRATSKEIYDGKGWDSKQKPVTYQVGYKGITTEKLEQKIQLAANFSSPVGFGASMPVQVTDLEGPYSIDGNGAIVLSIPDTKPGTSYTVVSQVPVLDEVSTKALRNSGNSYPRDISETYLDLPPSIPARVRDLALRITGGKNNPYDKAQALVDYFRDNEEFSYNLKPLPLPPGRDFVDYFLFDSKKGYCTYYSTSMAIMARSIGIPSRWVIGYSSGEFNERTPNIYRVSEMNKHAWVEIYFAGIGWIPFEPTKSFADPLAFQKVPTPQQNPQAGNSPQVTTTENSYKYKSLTGVGLIILVIILVYLWRRKPRDGQITLTNVIRRRRSSRRLVLAAYASFLKLMQRTGRTRVMGQTPREFAQAREGDMQENIDYIQRLTEVFEQVRYGKVNPSIQQAEQAQADLEVMKQKLS